MNSIDKKFSEIRDGFFVLEGQDKLVYLIDLGKKIDQIDSKDKVEENKVNACTSQTWIKIENDKFVTLKADSESAIVKGLSLIHI